MSVPVKVLRNFLVFWYWLHQVCVASTLQGETTSCNSMTHIIEIAKIIMVFEPTKYCMYTVDESLKSKDSLANI